MNKFLFMLFLTLGSVVLQTSVFPVFFMTPFKPDLLLILTVYLALRSTFEGGTPLAWILGLLKDVFSGLYLGLNAFVFLVIFLVIKSVSDRLYAESPFLFVVTVCAATTVCMTGNLLLLLMFTQSPGIFSSFLSGFVPHVLINAFCASIIGLLPDFSRFPEAQ